MTRAIVAGRSCLPPPPASRGRRGLRDGCAPLPPPPRSVGARARHTRGLRGLSATDAAPEPGRLPRVPHHRRRDRRRRQRLGDRARCVPERVHELLRVHATRAQGLSARGARADRTPCVRRTRPASARGERTTGERRLRAADPLARVRTAVALAAIPLLGRGLARPRRVRPPARAGSAGGRFARGGHATRRRRGRSPTACSRSGSRATSGRSWVRSRTTSRDACST